MNALVGSVLAALVLAGFVRPRWWLSLGPVAAAIALTGYRLLVSRVSSADAIALVGIVLLALAMQAALVAGSLARAGVERARQRPQGARAAVRAAGAISLVGVAFLGTLLAMARASSGVFALMALGAVVVVLARVWRARLKGAPASAARRPGTSTSVPIARRRPRTRTQRAGRRSTRMRRS